MCPTLTYSSRHLNTQRGSKKILRSGCECHANVVGWRWIRLKAYTLLAALTSQHAGQRGFSGRHSLTPAGQGSGHACRRTLGCQENQRLLDVCQRAQNDTDSQTDKIEIEMERDRKRGRQTHILQAMVLVERRRQRQTGRHKDIPQAMVEREREGEGGREGESEREREREIEKCDTNRFARRASSISRAHQTWLRLNAYEGMASGWEADLPGPGKEGQLPQIKAHVPTQGAAHQPAQNLRRLLMPNHGDLHEGQSYLAALSPHFGAAGILTLTCRYPQVLQMLKSCSPMLPQSGLGWIVNTVNLSRIGWSC